MMSRTKSHLFAILLGVSIATASGAETTAVNSSTDTPRLTCVNKAAEAARPKVVFQINKAEDAPLILRFVTNYLRAEPEAQIAVVGYASGIDFMLRSATDTDGNPYAIQINRLMDRGVAFKVCNNTLSARNATPDIVVAGVNIVPSAVNEIVRLQTQEGYSYFRN